MYIWPFESRQDNSVVVPNVLSSKNEYRKTNVGNLTSSWTLLYLDEIHVLGSTLHIMCSSNL